MCARFSDYLKKNSNVTYIKPDLNDLINTQSKSPDTTNQDFLYKVKSGDTLSKISKEYNVSVDDIAKANKIEDINKIYIDQEIVIPGKKEVVDSGMKILDSTKAIVGDKEKDKEVSEYLYKEIKPTPISEYTIKTTKPDLDSWKFNIPAIGDKLRSNEINKYKIDLSEEYNKWTDEFLNTLKTTPKENLKEVTRAGSEISKMFNDLMQEDFQNLAYPEMAKSLEKSFGNINTLKSEYLSTLGKDYGFESLDDLIDANTSNEQTYKEKQQELIDNGTVVLTQDGNLDLSEKSKKLLNEDVVNGFVNLSEATSNVENILISSLFDLDNITDMDVLESRLNEINNKYGDILNIEDLVPSVLDLNRLYILSNDVEEIDGQLNTLEKELDNIDANDLEKILSTLERDLSPEEMINELDILNINPETIEIVFDNLDRQNALLTKRQTLLDIDDGTIINNFNNALMSVRSILSNYTAKEDLGKILASRDFSDSQLGMALQKFLQTSNALKAAGTLDFATNLDLQEASNIYSNIEDLTKKQAEFIKTSKMVSDYLTLDKASESEQRARELEGAQVKNWFNKEYQDIDFGENLSTILGEGVTKLYNSFLKPALDIIMIYQDVVVSRGTLAVYKTLSTEVSYLGQQLGKTIGSTIYKLRGKSESEIERFIKANDYMIAREMTIVRNLPDGTINPIDVFKTYIYDDYAINNINRKTTKTFELTHDTTIDRLVPSNKKYSISEIKVLNPDLDLNNLKSGDVITMPIYDPMIRYLDGTISDQDRYELMANHPTVYEVTNQAMEIGLDPLTYVVFGLTDVFKIASGKALLSEYALFKTIASTGKFGKDIVKNLDNLALKSPTVSAYNSFITSDNKIIQSSLNSLSYMNEMYQGLFGRGISEEFLEKNPNLANVDDLFKKWRGVTAARTLPPKINDLFTTYARKNRKLLFESKEKSGAAMKELAELYLSETGKRSSKKQVSDRLIEIILNPSDGKLSEWAVLEKYGITRTGLIDMYKKILDDPIIGYVAKSDTLFTEIMKIIDKYANEGAASRRAIGWIADYSSQKETVQEIFNALKDTGIDSNYKKKIESVRNDLSNQVKNGIYTTEDVKAAEKLYASFQEQNEIARKLANAGAVTVSIPNSMYEVDFNFSNIISDTDLKQALEKGIVLTDKNTGLQVSFPKNEDVFVIRDFIFNAFQEEQLDALKSIYAIREMINHDPVSNGTVGYRRTINNTKKIIPGSEKYKSVESTEWQVTIKDKDGNDKKIVVDALDAADVDRQLKENNLIKTSDAVPQKKPGEQAMKDIIVEAEIERIKKDGKIETYVEKDWRAFDEDGNVYDVVDVKNQPTVNMINASSIGRNYTLYDLLLEQADSINLRIWKAGNKKTEELFAILNDVGQQKTKRIGNNLKQKKIYNIIDKEYNGLTNYLKLANNVENLYLYDKDGFMKLYNVLKSRYEKNYYKKIDGGFNTFRGSYTKYIKIRDEKLKFLLMDKLYDRNQFHAIKYKGQEIGKGKLLTDSQSALLNGRDLTSLEIDAIAKELDDVFNKKIKKDTALLSAENDLKDVSISKEAYLNKFNAEETIANRILEWNNIKKVYEEVKTTTGKKQYKKTSGDINQEDIVAGGTIKKRAGYVKTKRLDVETPEAQQIIKTEFDKIKRSLVKDVNKVLSKSTIKFDNNQIINGKTSQFFRDTWGKYFNPDDVRYYSYGISKRINKDITEDYLFKLMGDLKKRGISTIVGVDLPTNVIKSLKINGINVISVNKTFLYKLQKSKKITSKDLSIINKIRDTFFDEHKIEFWGSDLSTATNKGFEMSKMFQEKILSEFEREAIKINNNAIDATNKLIFNKKKVKGRDIAFTKDLNDPLLVVEPDPIKSLTRTFSESIAYARENNLKTSIRLGEMDKEIVENNPWKGKDIVIISKDSPYLNDDIVSTIKQRYAQGSNFILPEDKFMNAGEISIKEFLDKNKIPYTQSNITKLDDKFLLSNGVPSGKDITRKLNLYKYASDNNGLVYSYIVLKEKLIKGLDDIISHMRSTSYLLPSQKIKNDVKMGIIDSEEALRRMFAANERREIKSVWDEEKKITLDQYKNQRIDLYKFTNNTTTVPNDVLIGIEKDLGRIKNTLNGLDKYVLQWEKNPGTIERSLLKLRDIIEKKILESGDREAIEELLLNGKISDKRYNIDLAIYNYIFKGLPKLSNSLRGLWITFILRLRPAWYVWNALEDTFKYALATRDLAGTVKLALSQMESGLQYMITLSKDVSRVGLNAVHIEGLFNKIKKVHGPDTHIYKLADKLNKFSKELDLYSLNKLSSDQPLINVKDKHISNIVKFINNTRDKLYGNDFAKIDDLIKNGGNIDGVHIPKETMENILDSGMVETFTNAKELAKDLLTDTIYGSSWLDNLKLSFKKMDTNLSLFGSVTEESRRSFTAYRLMQKNAVDVVKTNMIIKEFFFDYRDLNKAEQLFRTVFPFLTYSIKSAKLYTNLVLKYYGYPAFRAAQAILSVWDSMVGEMESYNQEKVRIGNILFRPNFSLFEYLRFVQDPITSIKVWAENPLKAPLGLGFSPIGTELMENITGNDFFDLTRTELKNLGWTNESIEKYIREQEEEKNSYNSIGDIFKAIIDFVLDAAPSLKVANQLLFEIDDAAMKNPGHILKYKTFREISKFLGLNITEYNDYDEFTTKLYQLDPVLRSSFINQMKKESPELYKKMQDNSIIGAMVTAIKEEMTEEDAQEYIMSKIYQQSFYDMEAENPGSGYATLETNAEMKKALQDVWGKAKGKYAETKAAKAKIRQNDKIIKEFINKNIPSNLTTQEIVDKYKIIGGEFDLPINKEQLEYDLLGKGFTPSDVNVLLKSYYADTGIPMLNDEEVLNIKKDSMAYNLLSVEEKKAKSLADQAYYKKLSAAQRIFPINYNDLTSEEKNEIYNKYLDMLEKNLTPSEYKKWLEDRPEIEQKYREYQKKYINIWSELLTSNKNYYKNFYDKPEWFQEFYFISHPNAKIYYPIQEERERRLSDIIASEQLGYDMSDERTSLDNWYWNQTIALNALEKDKPGTIKYMKEMKRFSSSVNENNYYTELLKQPQWFLDIYYEKNPNAKIYTQQLSNLEQLSGVEYSTALNKFAESEAGKKYAETHPIINGHNKLEYKLIWDKLINNETDYNYYDEFYKQPEWFKTYFFNANPLKKIYYKFKQELSQKKGSAWSEYLWSDANKTAREAWFRDKPEDRNYYKEFISPLYEYASNSNWKEYYDFLLDDSNKEYFDRWANDDTLKIHAAKLSKTYYSMPDSTWQDKKKKSDWLTNNQALQRYWNRDKTEEELELSKAAEEFYRLKYDIANEGSGYDYYYQYKKNQALRNNILKTNISLSKYLYKDDAQLADEDSSVISLLKEYNRLTDYQERKDFISNNPELKEYFMNNIPNGIKNVRQLQDEYFALTARSKSQLSQLRSKFLKDNPDLKTYWDINALPDSAFTDKTKFDEWQKTWNKIERYYDSINIEALSQSETLRQSLPSEYVNPGSSEEAVWLKYKIYGKAMETWIDLMSANKTVGMYYFRQLPSWVRDKYYQSHPENRWISGTTLKTWLISPVANYYNDNKSVAWALQQQKIYGSDMPINIKTQVETILIRAGVWEDRSRWTNEMWTKYWEKESLEKAGLKAYDYAHIPLLRTELNKALKLFPLLLSNNTNYAKYLKPIEWDKLPLLTRV